MKLFLFFGIAIAAGSMITIQSVLNAALGQRTGNLGSVLILTFVSMSVLLLLILLFPATANLRSIPGPSQWYLYVGGVLGVAILAAPIFLIPRIGATSTLTGLVVGQLLLALFLDHFGAFGVPKIEIDATRLVGGTLLVLGTFFISR